MADREAFEAAYKAINPITPTRETAWLCWQAAERATAQRCRELCEKRNFADIAADAIAREFGLDAPDAR